MTTETLALDGVLASSGLSGATVANLATQDANWATATSNNVATSLRASVPTPTGPPRAGSNLQTITVQTRKSASSGTGTPTATIGVGVNGTKQLTSSSFAINAASASSQLNSFTFDFGALSGAAANGSDLEIWVETAQSGGLATVRASADIGYVAWIADVGAPAPTEPGPRRPGRHSYWA